MSYQEWIIAYEWSHFMGDITYCDGLCNEHPDYYYQYTQHA